MTIDELRTRITARPFRPYAISWDRACFVVERPEAVACDETGQRLTVFLTEGVQLTTSMSAVDIGDPDPAAKPASKPRPRQRSLAPSSN